jgi:hypothetical protein
MRTQKAKNQLAKVICLECYKLKHIHKIQNGKCKYCVQKLKQQQNQQQQPSATQKEADNLLEWFYFYDTSHHNK